MLSPIYPRGKGPWDSMDKKFDSRETKPNACIGNQMSVIQPTACHFTMIWQLRKLLHLFIDLYSLYTEFCFNALYTLFWNPTY